MSDEPSARLKEEKLNRREDYELGPIRPKRDVGDLKSKYGTLDNQALQGLPLPQKELFKRLEPFGGKYLNIWKGDRVVILEGPDKGKIGIISAIDGKKAKVTVKDLNRVDIQIPQVFVEKENPDQRPVSTIDGPMDINSVRVVATIPGKDGNLKDVIVKQFVNTNFRKTRSGYSWSRMIPGLDIIVPWPKREKRVVKPKADTPSDTLRIDVDVQSYIPTLLRPPMPRSVIDELRNKFSVFRTRHEPEYIAAKEAEEQAKLDQKKTIKAMRTPLMEAKRKERKMKKKLAKKQKLTPDMWEKIGKTIAAKKGYVGKEDSGPTPEVLPA
ncbi:putative 54S ribosomal protein L40, mitochondrial [Glarea lozoyensis 74030]|uniref:Putative 54S ribosomal protein L40, mitochondrial n=1 Tax=Glarea lozoyensis (strain ATCC 74030 / MF5533) TaxID=1104152 RepID=H0ETZ9_GLAL7|nr:putative 54S ribosomal protein L40, mitochondrial [Glarea lozoyensis 74030]